MGPFSWGELLLILVLVKYCRVVDFCLRPLACNRSHG
jgi:hypothetical protein